MNYEPKKQIVGDLTSDFKYYSRSLYDTNHLYKYNPETKAFYWMDHCWTGEGEWVLRDEPIPDLVEISEERAMEISKGTIYTAKHFDK